MVIVCRGCFPKALPATMPPRSVQAFVSWSIVHFGSTSRTLNGAVKRCARGELYAGGEGRWKETRPIPSGRSGSFGLA